MFSPLFFPSFSSIAGSLAAFATFSVSEEAFLSWGWRVTFLASAVMAVMGLVIRFTITESPDFEKVEGTHRDQRLPIVTVPAGRGCVHRHQGRAVPADRPPEPPVIAALFTELFSAEVRYSGASLGYQIGSVLGGGLAPTVAAALYANWGSSAPISLYLTAATLLSLLCVVAITRKVRTAA
ncbi:MFS transporter [Rhodococcus opacus]|uniref:MFS transporter n=1 Tax=Rhodococcus opacus TaxID=37919 RepID=A0A1B1KCD3_RHOOP|nr:MFS transporter [Rhodococcus opacus]ANS30261.1 MFS transporter [Rhodococcus opacus]